MLKSHLPFFGANWKYLLPHEKSRLMVWGAAFYVPIVLGILCTIFLPITWGIFGLGMGGGLAILILRPLKVIQPFGNTAYEVYCGLDIIASYLYQSKHYQFKRTFGYIYLVVDGWVIKDAKQIPAYFIDEGIIEDLETECHCRVQIPQDMKNLDAEDIDTFQS